MSRVIADGLSEAGANFPAMPQVGGDPIVESGSNADGEWTRWSDGTQIAISIGNSTTPETSDLLALPYNEPASFTSLLHFTVYGTTSNSFYTGVKRTDSFTVLLGGSSVYLGFTVNVTSATIGNLDVLIIGRWK